MLRFSICTLLVALVSATTVFASAKRYDGDRIYEGGFASQRIYQLDPESEIYYPSSRFKFLSEIRCTSAQMDLERFGVWSGNLSDSGECLGSVEAPEYATGNFLNYRAGKKSD